MEHRRQCASRATKSVVGVKDREGDATWLWHGVCPRVAPFRRVRRSRQTAFPDIGTVREVPP